MKEISGIYCITNLENNKKYYGQALNVERRLNTHKWELMGNYHHNAHLQNSWNKYGKDAFKFDLVVACKVKYLDRLERLYIRVNNTMNNEFGYNKESGGNKNKFASKETRRKIGLSKKGPNHPNFGKNLSKETCMRISKALTGNTLSKKHREKISENNAHYWLGKHLSKETRQKLSIAHTGKKMSAESRKKMSEAKKGSKCHMWKNYARVIKHGIVKGKQKYAIMYEGKKIKFSYDKHKLEKMCEKINNNEIDLKKEFPKKF